MRTNRVVVLFSDEEFEALRKIVGDVPLSLWIRKRVLDGKIESRGYTAVEVRDDDPVPTVAQPRGKVCEHGMPKGHRCWQCGGLAKA